MREGFEMATSANLPELSSMALCDFINKHLSVNFESSGTKLQRSSRAEYGDQSIGYVELRRETNVVTLYAKVTPEHKIRGKGYTVFVVINEEEGVILQGQCEDCPAAQGGCKHLVAFLFWVHRRSEEPSPTEVACYWKKSRLSTVGTTKFISLKDICGEKYKVSPQSNSDFVDKFKATSEEKDINNMISSLNSSKFDTLSLHHLKYWFNKTADVGPEKFLDFCKSKINPQMCSEVQKLTVKQASSKLWFELRYGRITASVLHDAAHCSTEDGSLVNKILGSKTYLSEPMKRGKLLEESILKVTSRLLKKNLKKCGLFINKEHPFFGATPDALGDDFVVEIKAPASKESFETYFTKDRTPAKKYYAQVQLQMLFVGFTKGLFVVAHHDFEESQQIEMLWVNLDKDYLTQMLEKSTLFWKNFVYKYL